jgi:UDP-2-acetamido-2,6-beta-L-arabino-hexul-4-ose reductase
VTSYDIDDSFEVLERSLAGADALIHLAGANRPLDPAGFDQVNRGLTEELCQALQRQKSRAHVIFSSSTQAELDNPYGKSKLAGEEALKELAVLNGNPVTIFRFTNVFGKWARPNYNSAVATFCYNVAHDLPIKVDTPERVMRLICIDDVVAAIVAALDSPPPDGVAAIDPSGPEHEVRLDELADTIQSFPKIRTGLTLPDLSNPLTRKLYSTYLSYVEGPDREYRLDIKSDDRGALAEFVKSPQFGQVFVSRTKPGVTRGNHYHELKLEKFLVLEGQAVIRFRKLGEVEIQEHHVRGEDFTVVDITPGWVHSIENVGTSELITLFWAGEIFNPTAPDTFAEKVL